MNTRKMKRIPIITLLVILVVLVIWVIWGNTALELNTYTITGSKLPERFDGYRIAHISDLHNAQIGKENEKLLAVLREAEPDIIAITGDLIDSRNTDVDVALQFAQEAVKIAPSYYVTGNHEARVNEYNELKSGLLSAGVIVLEDNSVEICIAGEYITLVGVNDPSFETDYLLGDSETVMQSTLSELLANSDGFTILLSHRPELFDTYADCEIDLVLSGHAHGGQFQIPFVGGVVAPNQGFFPEFDTGIYTEENTNMLVSRGIGNSIIPVRVNNRPEVILIELNSNE